MVAIIHQSKSLRNSLHYNENKVGLKVAELIHAGNYPKDAALLGFTDKINRLERQALLNQQTKVNSVHISLNFDTGDQLSTEKLQTISDVYMQKIGFGEQPYLVYRHHDAGHEHIHIVTTNIKQDGKRIELHNLARNQSLQAAQQIEKEFHLVQAMGKHRLDYQLKPANVQKVRYGKSETKRAITNVLDQVLPQYKYTSLAELNAVLRQYNIMADRGSENSRIFKNRGLVYRILNEKGEKIGIPVKASLIYNNPGLTFIEAKFSMNESARQQLKIRVKNAIDLSFVMTPAQSLEKWMEGLQKERIQVVLRQNDKGIIYGLTYIDYMSKCVFNGSDLGKAYSANAILKRCSQEQILLTAQQQKQIPALSPDNSVGQPNLTLPNMTGFKNTLEEVMQPQTEEGLATELRSDDIRKKKRKKLRP